MATLQQVKALAKRLGAKVEDEKTSHTHECRVEAPHRKHWVDGRVHELVDGRVHELVDCTNTPWKPDYKDLLARMNHGLEDCIGYCEWCDDDK